MAVSLTNTKATTKETAGEVDASKESNIEPGSIESCVEESGAASAMVVEYNIENAVADQPSTTRHPPLDICTTPTLLLTAHSEHAGWQDRSSAAPTSSSNPSCFSCQSIASSSCRAPTAADAA